MHPGMHPGIHPGMHPGMPQGAPQSSPPQQDNHIENDPVFDQAQAMLDNALGEDAGMFKEILGAMGMNDKEFWKGAMIGAAAALLLSNEKVRGKFMGGLSSASDMIKSGGSTLKETATNTTSAVKENVNVSGEIFKDTYTAGKEGFKDSVDRHQEAKQATNLSVDTENTSSSVEEEITSS
jgi:gas vesicle protein